MKSLRLRTGAEETRWFVRLLVGLAFLALCGAALEWLTRSVPPFKGRWAWFVEVVFALTGPTGLIFLWVLLAIVLSLAARFVWRHTPKTPADRWW